MASDTDPVNDDETEDLMSRKLFRSATRSKVGLASLALAAASSAVAVAPSLTDQASAQTPAPYDCVFTGIPLPVAILPFTLSGSATASPSPANVGDAVSLSNGSVKLDILPGVDTSALVTAMATVPTLTGEATLAPSGTLSLPTGSFNAGDVSFTFSGGTGNTTAAGTAGGTMDLTVPKFSFGVVGSIVIDCTPQSTPAVLASVPLNAAPTTTTAAGGGAGGSGTSKPAVARPGRPNHAG